ncbi:hypothetical protein CXF74_16670 [Psychromonas sp. Urea-02u-13]|nr:hypothetical protein CXF74_16670 [Psychromonas sp. Urea-02u-13]
MFFKVFSSEPRATRVSYTSSVFSYLFNCYSLKQLLSAYLGESAIEKMPLLIQLALNSTQLRSLWI